MSNHTVTLVLSDKTEKEVKFKDEFYEAYKQGYLKGLDWFDKYYSIDNYFRDSKLYANQMVLLFKDGDERIFPLAASDFLSMFACDYNLYSTGFKHAMDFRFRNAVNNLPKLKRLIKDSFKIDLTGLDVNVIKPFSNHKNLKLFKFIELKWVSNKNKNRWTHLYEFIKEKEKALTISEYNNFIKKEYDIDFTHELNYHAGFPKKRRRDLESYEDEFNISSLKRKKLSKISNS